MSFQGAGHQLCFLSGEITWGRVSRQQRGHARPDPARPGDRMRRSCSSGVACSLLLLTLAGAGLRAPPAVPPPLPGCVSASPFRLPFSSSSRVAALEFRGLLPRRRCRRRPSPPPPPSVSSPQTAPAPHEPKHKHSGSGAGTASAGSAT